MDKVLIAIEDDSCIKKISKMIMSYPFKKDSLFRIVHVAKDPKQNSFMGMIPDKLQKEVKEERLRRGRRLTSVMSAELSALALKSETAVLEGNPRDVLLNEVESFHPDITLLATHRKTGLAAMGSVSHGVTARTENNVIVVV